MRSTLLSALLGLLLIPTAFAQVGTIRGTVVDQTGQAIPGVNVVLDGTTLGTASDLDGEYSFQAPAGTYTLIARAIGYQTVRLPDVVVTRDQTTTQNITIREDILGLEDVIVTGYSVIPRREATGAQSSISARDIQDLPVTNAEAILQGRAAGVQVISNSGAPGASMSVRIRGTGSIDAGVEPLYIVDGVQINNDSQSNLSSTGPLSSINPNDIESIEVLKDVASTSIYGSQAANGVVLITTKSGRSGRTNVTFSASTGTTERIKDYDVLNAEQYITLKNEAFTNRYVLEERRFTQEFIDGFVAANYGVISDSLQSTDWQDAVFRTGTNQTYEVAVDGGSNSTQFYISGSYQSVEGQVLASEFERFGGTMSVTQRVSPLLQVEARAVLASIQQRGTISNGAFINSPHFSAQFINPQQPVYNRDGTFNYSFTGDTFGYNPVATETLNDRQSDTNQLIGNVGLNWNFGKGFRGRSYAGVQYLDLGEYSYNDPRIPQFAGTNGSAFTNAERQTSYNLSQTLNFSGVAADVHSINSLVGIEYKFENLDGSSANAQQFPNELFRTIAAASDFTNVNSFGTQFSRLSFFTQGNYSFDDRYIFTGTLRYDGSSRFGSENRFGIFGSVSAAWRLSSEAFLSNVDWLDDLKLRASYGVVGNDNIGNFTSRQLFGVGGEYLGRTGIAPSQLGNPFLTWEESEQANIGLDFLIANGRLSGSVDVFRNNSNQLLLDRPLAGDSGFGSQTENVGTLRNEGIELEGTATILDRRNFSWSVNSNITFLRNEVVDLFGDTENIGVTIRKGEALSALYYPEYAGVNPADGRPFWYDINGELTYSPTAEDSKVIGDTSPDYYGGFGTQVSASGFTLDVLFQYDFGRDVFNNDNLFLLRSGSSDWNQSERGFTDRWQRPGDVTDMPRPYQGGTEPGSTGESLASSRHIEDASYMRLKQVRLSYQLPRSLMRSISLASSSVYVQGGNLLTWTNYTGLDPEQAATFSVGRYPVGRTFTAGVRVGL